MISTKHTIVALVENKPGVLNRVASLFRRRNFNIDSLTVGRTESPAISRMTIVVNAEESEQVQKQLFKLINVIQVEEVTDIPNISRDLALIKVKADRDARAEVMRLCEIFRARIVDAGQETVVVEVTGDEEKISGMIDLLRPLGIMEMVRTGVVTMARGERVLSANGYLSRNGNGSGDWASVL